ncbi:unnamed protein product, partial [Ixodes hexagonus]
HRQNHGGGGVAGMSMEESVIRNVPKERPQHRARGSRDVERLRCTRFGRCTNVCVGNAASVLFFSSFLKGGTAAEPRCKGCVCANRRPTTKRTTLQCKRHHLCQPRHVC